MIFDDLGLPRDTGATDWGDSASRAGVLMVFAPGDMDPMKMYLYVKMVDGHLEGMRHPREVPSNNWKNFTRDQLICLAAGLKKSGRSDLTLGLYQAAVDRWYRAQDTEADVVGSTKKFPNGADLLMPNHMNHLRMCAGLKPTLFGKLWLTLDILYHSTFAATEEPNQLLSMCMIAGPWFVRLYKNTNSKWKQGITDYWSDWRNEDAFAQKMIQTVEAI